MAADPKGQELLDALEASATVAEPSSESTADTEKVPVLCNYDTVDVGGKQKPQGLSIDEVRSKLYEITGGWPKRVEEVLFTEGEGHQPIYLNSTAKLFGWMDERAIVDWARRTDCVTQERFFANLQMFAEAWEVVETVPHFPTVPGAYYMHPELPDTNGTYLEQFVDFFTPLTPTDRELIKAFVLTLFWGGPPGKRPAFLITGPDQDSEPEKKGRGTGKSTLVSLVSQLVGGMLTFSSREDMKGIKTRLLSPNALQLRLALLDNLKTLRFSWADLEGLITSPVISGHRMYHGEGRRPNNLVWALTLNGATLSKDMAERCVIIKVKRPEYDPNWQPQVEDYIRTYRWEIINDIRLCLVNQ